MAWLHYCLTIMEFGHRRRMRVVALGCIAAAASSGCASLSSLSSQRPEREGRPTPVRPASPAATLPGDQAPGTAPAAGAEGAAGANNQDQDTTRRARRTRGSAGQELYQGLVLLGAGRLTEARRAFLETLEVAPRWGLAYLHLGVVEQLMQPGSQAAVDALTQATLLSPDNARAFYQLGIACQSAGDWQAAAAAFARAAELRGELVDALFRRGNVLTHAGDDAGALASYRAALVRDPNHLGALAAVAILAEQQGELAAAEEALLRIGRLHPGVAYHQYNLARFYERVGRPDDARDAYARAEQIDPRPKRQLRLLK